MTNNINVLKGKNCFISGATGGLGRSIATELALNNCNLFLTSTNKVKLKKLQKELSNINPDIKIDYDNGDLTKLHDIKKIIKKFRSTGDKCDILINCAGIFSIKSISRILTTDYDTCFDVNVRAPVLFCKEFSNDMKKRKWGRIVNIGSSSSYEGFSDTSIYSATKHAILGFSRSLQRELKSYGIRTYCISPGSIKTSMGKRVKGQSYSTFINPKEIASVIVNLIQFDKEMLIEEIRLDRMDKK